jgi:hypothetical protein
VAGDLGGFEVRTDEDGGYRFEGLPPVPGRVEASLRSGGSASAEFAPAGGAAAAVVDLVVDAGLLLEGTVRAREGGPLAGIRVAARPPAGGGSDFAESDAAGRWSMRVRDARPRLVRFVDPSGARSEARIEGVEAPRSGVDAVLAPDPEAPGRYSFRVESGGAPVAGPLRVVEVDAETGAVVGTTTRAPGPGGVVGPVRARRGRYRVLVRGDGGAASSAEFAVEGGGHADGGTLRLEPGVEVRGRVAGPGDGAPAGALLLVLPGLLPEPGQPRADGSFEVRGLPPPGGTLRLLHPAAEDLEVRWRAGGGERIDLGELRLRPATGRLRGTVRSAKGDPVPGALVVAARADPGAAGISRRVVAGPDGRFEIRGVPAGRWDLGAAAPREDGTADDRPDGVLVTSGSGYSVALPGGGEEEADLRIPE